MAYGEKYIGEFGNSRFQTRWKITIEELDYVGASSNLILGATPALLRKNGDGDPFKVLQGSELTINIQHQPGDDFSDLFTTDRRKYFVTLHLMYGALPTPLLYWSGYVLPGQSVHSFDPYRLISIIASDGITQLKDNIYVNAATGYPYDGYEKIIINLANALTRTGLSVHIKNAVNLLPEEYNTTPATSDDVFNIVSSKNQRLQDADLNPSSCKVSIEAILKSFGAQIFQGFGMWWIMRYSERFQTSIKFREFDESGSYLGSSTLTSQVSLTNSEGDPLCVPVGGAHITDIPSFKTVTTIQDFGLRQSLFAGWDFPPNEFDAVSTARHFIFPSPTKWDKYSVGDDYVVRCTSGADDGNYFATEWVQIEQGAGNTEYRLVIKCGASNNLNLQVLIELEVGGGNYYYWKPGAIWILHTGEPNRDDAFKMWVVQGHIDEPNTIDITKHFLISSIPVSSGNLRIKFFDDINNPYIAEVKLTPVFGGDWEYDWYTEVNSSLIDVDNPESKEPVKMLYTDGTGMDNSGPFSDGVLVMEDLAVFPTPTSEWANRGDGVTNTYRLRKWIAQNHIDATKLLQFRGTLIVELFHFYNTIKIEELDDKIFIPDDVIMDLKMSSITGTFIEVKDMTKVISLTPAPANPTVVGNIETSGGNSAYNSTGVIGDGNTAPFQDYRSGTESLASGNQTIPFSNAFASGVTYTLFTKIISSDGFVLEGIVSSEDEVGFDIDINESAAILTYFAIKIL